jgi:ornithine carbamoyltransferase
LSLDMKANPSKYATVMKDKTLAMIFQKPSLRTRVSFETGMTKMGGHAIYLSTEDIQLGRGETVADTSIVLSHYADIMMARVYAHADIITLAENASIPVINGLTDFDHPCQILADMLTIYEKKGALKGLKIAFLGDCTNNTCHSWLMAAHKVGMKMSCAFPEGYAPSEQALGYAKDYELTDDPKKALEGADVVYTDTWMSIHIPEEERQKRMLELTPYSVTSELMEEADKNAIFMHCLPAHRGEEMSAAVIDGPQSVVFDQAENRMWMQDAIMLTLLKNQKT